MSPKTFPVSVISICSFTSISPFIVPDTLRFFACILALILDDLSTTILPFVFISPVRLPAIFMLLLLFRLPFNLTDSPTIVSGSFKMIFSSFFSNINSSLHISYELMSLQVYGALLFCFLSLYK